MLDLTLTINLRLTRFILTFEQHFEQTVRSHSLHCTPHTKNVKRVRKHKKQIFLLSTFSLIWTPTSKLSSSAFVITDRMCTISSSDNARRSLSFTVSCHNVWSVVFGPSVTSTVSTVSTDDDDEAVVVATDRPKLFNECTEPVDALDRSDCREWERVTGVDWGSNRVVFNSWQWRLHRLDGS